MLIASITLSALLGAAWRRWWGDERPAWAPPGYRAAQAAIGFAMLAAICILAGHAWWGALLRSALALAFMAAMAESIPHIWRAWDWVDSRWSMRSRWRLFDGYTTKAELTAGAVVWSGAVWL